MAATNLFFFGFLLLPFQFSLGSIGGSDIAIIRLLVPLVIVGWGFYSLLKKQLILPRPLTLFVLSSFLVWMLLSVFWAENQAWALRKAFFWLTFFPFFLALSHLFQNTLFRTKALQGLVWGGGIIALVGILQFLAQFFLPFSRLSELLFIPLTFFLGENFASVVAQYPSIFVNIGGTTFVRAFGFFPDPHIFAYYVTMVLPLALYQAWQKKSTPGARLLPWILLVAALLSFSRASYVALVLAGAVLGARVFWQQGRKLSVSAILITVTLLGALLFSPVANRFVSSFSETDGSVSERSRLWQEAVQNIGEAPLAGVGLGNYPLKVKPSAEPREPIYVHNLYLDMVVEIGLVGLALFLLFIYSCLPTDMGRGQNLSNIGFSAQSTLLPYRFALLLSLLIFLTHSFFEYPLFSVHILPLFLTLLALLYVEKIRVS